MEPKRFYRSTSDRKIAGVAGGLAEYFVMDPLLVRLIFVVLVFAGGGGGLIYLILWIVTPEKPFDPSSTINQTVMENQPSQQPEGALPPKKEPRKKGSLIGGLVLITLGSLFLIDEFIPNLDFGDLWPVILIVIGIGLLINTVIGRNQHN
jgi:phage shock protein C